MDIKIFRQIIWRPRARFKDSLDQILSIDYDREKVFVCLESKVFGIGMESYTVGSMNLL